MVSCAFTRIAPDLGAATKPGLPALFGNDAERLMKTANNGLPRWIIGMSAAVALLSGCATTSSSITGKWQTPKTRTEPYTSVIVVAAAIRDEARSAFELTLANSILSSGSAKATTTFNSIQTSQVSKDSLLQAAEQANAEAIIVTRILDQSFQDSKTADEVITHWGPAVSVSQNEDSNITTVVSSDHWTEVVPGSFALDTHNLVETSVYESSTGGLLVYRATLKADFKLSASQRATTGAAVFADEIARRLRKDGVIR